MVSDYTRNNIILLVVILTFGIVIGFYVSGFQNAMIDFGNFLQQTAKNTTTEIKTTVNQSSANMTSAINHMVNLKEDEVQILRNVSTILVEEREDNKKNLGLFLTTFSNQSKAEVNATQHLETAFNATIGKSQNLTAELKETTDQRNKILEQLINVLINKTGAEDQIIRGNLTPILNQTN